MSATESLQIKSFYHIYDLIKQNYDDTMSNNRLKNITKDELKVIFDKYSFSSLYVNLQMTIDAFNLLNEQLISLRKKQHTLLQKCLTEIFEQKHMEFVHKSQPAVTEWCFGYNSKGNLINIHGEEICSRGYPVSINEKYGYRMNYEGRRIDNEGNTLLTNHLGQMIDNYDNILDEQGNILENFDKIKNPDYELFKCKDMNEVITKIECLKHYEIALMAQRFDPSLNIIAFINDSTIDCASVEKAKKMHGCFTFYNRDEISIPIYDGRIWKICNTYHHEIIYVFKKELAECYFGHKFDDDGNIIKTDEPCAICGRAM